jgi:MFS family permease
MESSAQAANPASAPALDPRRWWALALLCSAFFMVILDASIVFVGLPSIGADLGFSGQGLQWVVSAYALTFGACCSWEDGRPTCSGAGARSWSVSCSSRVRRCSAGSPW